MGTLQTVTAFVAVNGLYLPCVSCEIHMTRHAAADTFHAVLAMSTPGVDISYWSTAAPIAVTVSINGQQLFQGNVNHVGPDWDSRLFDIEGKDNTQALAKHTKTEKHLNKTAVDAATAMASPDGFSIDSDSGTLLVGKSYQIDWHRIRDRTSTLTALQRMAAKEGLSVAVKNNTITFKDLDDDSLPIYSVTYSPPTPQSYAQGTFVKMNTGRNLEVSSTQKANVKSWDHKAKKVITSTKTMSGDGGDETDYNIRHPKLTQDQADRIGSKHLNNAARHEMDLELDAPGDTTVTPQMNLSLSGTNTAWDQNYSIDTVEHRVDTRGGYRMTLNCKTKKQGRSAS